MTFRQLAFRNIWGNRHAYGSFFLSSVFAVAIFFVYAAFIFHPSLARGEIAGGSGTKLALIGCEWIIIVFSFFFILYASSSFLKTRQKEFGLLFLFGFTRGQLRKLIVSENLLLGTAAIVAGTAVGLLFSKLFFMVLTWLMNVANPIPFYWPWKAIAVTAGGYFVLFLVIAAASMRQAGRKEVAELLLAAKQPKRAPAASPWLSALAAACLAGGYAMAVTMSAGNLLFRMLPILFLVTTGTYFLFTQLSVGLLRRLQRNRELSHRGTNLVVLSQLVYRIKDNARVLFLTSVLCAVVVTAAGTITVFMNAAETSIVGHFPQTLAFQQQGKPVSEAELAKIEAAVRAEGGAIAYRAEVTGIAGSLQLGGGRKLDAAMVVSASAYNGLAARLPGVESVEVKPGHAWFVYPYADAAPAVVAPGTDAVFRTGDRELKLRMDGQRNGGIVQATGPSTFVVVLDDGQFAEWRKGAAAGTLVYSYGYELRDWRHAGAAIDRAIKAVPSLQISSRLAEYESTRQFTSLSLFIALFVSALFFLASGSLLFFKLFTELREEQSQFRSLLRIGLSPKELGRILTTQIAILFFIPCLVGGLHASFAMVALGRVLLDSKAVFVSAVEVMGIYLALQTVYFLVARRAYARTVARDAGVAM
ncbi:ABC transporter permease [Cohnella sp. REN36]|uniref:ABC transporter permease n=1 Tax=Cohnella sp. REN36 TaxID=2887347 RepID=UPI001D14E6C1|nr:ABC transporter permease [Cohnella sp. REN36]MCC3375792.1 ABC transporter permease [Cohnella sp. REN36]